MARLAARLRSLWRGIFHRPRIDDDLDEELSAYIEEFVARKERAGLPGDAARREARREMGGASGHRRAPLSGPELNDLRLEVLRAE